MLYLFVISQIIQAVLIIYLDTEYTDFTQTTTSALGIAQAGNCVPFNLPTGTQACITDFSGKPLDRAPKHALTAAGNYMAPINNNWNLIINSI